MRHPTSTTDLAISTAISTHDLPVGSRRRGLDLVHRQLVAVEAFPRDRVKAQRALEVTARTRETRMDVVRRLDVLRREQEMLVARAHQQLGETGDLLRAPSGRRAVIAHRNAWFASKLAELLAQADVQLLERVDNGADAVGLVVAEQPDLLFVEDSLLMVTGDEVILEARRFCPGTRIGARVEYDERVGVLLEAGADMVATRQVPPLRVAQQLLALVGTPAG
ncbi:MAG: hypothetical protein QOD70_2289 [Frankiales bacterium]|nr:hypothetical protein [Frankiales bacterium]